MSQSTALQLGVYYHVFNRGNNRENAFFEERNYRYFLQLYAKYIVPVADTYAYCLLPNHFHLLLRTKTEEEQQVEKTFRVSETRKVSRKVLLPSRQFSHLLNAYTKAVNRAYERSGSVFEKPFRRLQITSDAHFAHLVVYIHRNPEKHGLVPDFRDWPYSSYHTMLSTEPTKLARDGALAWFDGPAGFQQVHRQDVPEGQIATLSLEDLL